VIRTTTSNSERTRRSRRGPDAESVELGAEWGGVDGWGPRTTSAVITEATVSVTRRTCIHAARALALSCPFTAVLHQLLCQRRCGSPGGLCLSVTIATAARALISYHSLTRRLQSGPASRLHGCVRSRSSCRAQSTIQRLKSLNSPHNASCLLHMVTGHFGHFSIKTLWDTSAPISRHFDTSAVIQGHREFPFGNSRECATSKIPGGNSRKLLSFRREFLGVYKISNFSYFLL